MAATIVDIKDPADIVTPAAGTVELFMDSTNNNHLSYMNSSRVITDLEEGSENEDCACDIQTQFWSTLSCALNNGMITGDQFQAAVNAGFNTTASTVTDNAGNSTSTINSGVILIPPVSVVISPNPIPMSVLAATPQQLSAAVLPASANQAVVWVSSDVTKATVDSTGLVTAVGIGTVVIYAYSVSDLSVSSSVSITIGA